MLTQVHRYTASSDLLQRPYHGGSKQKLIVSVRKSLDSMVRKTKEKNIFWGIEVAETLNWHGWSLGREFTKHLTLRNVCLKTQKLKFRPPTTRFFITVFPQPIILSPGMSLTLPIIFRPLEKKEYEDRIFFEKREGEFSVALRARLPRLDLLFPESIQLPPCAVYDCTEASFILYNDGDLLTSYSWEVPTPFTFVPSRGMLDPGEECTVKVIFQPQVALVHDVSAICSFGDIQEHKKAIKLNAIAKYPHLLVYVPGDPCEDVKFKNFRDVLCFGSVGVGSTVERYVEIYNASVVSAPFRIERTKEPVLRDLVFSCDVTQAVVPAGGKSIIPLQFSPRTVGAKSVDYFTIMPAGNITHSVLKVTGSCKGPEVSFQHPFVYFNCANLGECLVQRLDITNNSRVPAYYQFDMDSKQSVFSFDHPCGLLAGMSTTTLNVTFQPTHPIIFHRRVVCLVHHQEPLFLDLLGTCHSKTLNPRILKVKDLTRYRTHMARGLTFYPPDILGTMLQEGKLLVDENGALTLPPEMLEDKSPEEYPFIEPMVEYFHDGESSNFTVFPPHVSLSIKEFDFGCCAKLQEVEPLPLCLTNHTKGKITVIWTSKSESPFQVNPESCDIPPLKSMAFRITFQPPQLNSLYAAELEGFAFYKVLRHFSNIEEYVTMCPPWSLTIRLRGHTFEPGRQHFIPKYILDCDKVFPPVCRNTTTHRSMLLCNVGTTAINFNMSLEKCPSVLVKPRCGFIAPGTHQIFLLSTCPEETSVHQHTLSLHLNYCPSYTQEMTLQSSAEPLALLLEGDGSLYFKPTCVGTSSSRTFTIKNCTRLSMLFRWKIQQSDKKLLFVQPDQGTVLPNEALAQTWTFTPGEQTKYLLRSWITVWRDQETLDNKAPESIRYILRIIGEGALGTITAQEEQVDVGSILVGSTQSCELVLINDGVCSLKYILSVEQMITGPCDPEEVANDPLAIELDHSQGTISARGKVFLHATLSPTRQLHYTWTVSYAISTPKATEPLGEKQSICCVMATGIYPSICITDACGTGSACGISKLHLWRLFSLEALNQYLERDPTPQELTFRVPTRHSTKRTPRAYAPVMLDFNFGAAPVRSEPSAVVLMLQNNGAIPVNWAFLFPSDQKIDMEYWAESTEFDPSELHQMRIQDNQLFSISPKSGKLLPGQEQTIHLSHRHDFIGTDRLPVLLKVSHGREILLNFIGVTLELERHYIHFTSTKHVFTPIAIGTYDPPKQIYELYNGGSTSVVYEIQLDTLMKVQQENYHHLVFNCLNPKGEIAPGLTAQTEWIFSPLEAKMYSVDVPIHILKGDSALITFQGIGYDPFVMGESARFDKIVSPATTPGSARLSVPGLGASKAWEEGICFTHLHNSVCVVGVGELHTSTSQTVYLSQPRICFGNIPVYSKCSRVFFLNNASEDESIVFAWHIGTAHSVVTLSILPETGVVQAGDSIQCVLTLYASESPCFYNIDLVCEIFTQQPLDKYYKELQEWETEKARQAVEFTITEKDLITEKKRTPNESSDESSKLASDTLKSPKVFAEIRKYKTLPPIKNFHGPNLPASRSQRRQRRSKDTSRLWAQPEPPKPYFMHLGVTARSHTIDDFLSVFSDDLPQHFLYRQLKKKAARKKVADKASLSRYRSRSKRGSSIVPNWQALESCSEQEAQLVTDMLSTVIKGLLVETQFQEAVIRSLEEPIPYFCQFWSKESAKLHGKKQSPGGISPTSCSPEFSPKEKIDEENTGEKEASSARTSNPGESLSFIIRKEQSREQKEAIIRMPAFANLAEMVMDNTIQNILAEASRGEVVLTARPRIIAFPSSFAQKGTSPAMSMQRPPRSQPHVSPLISVSSCVKNSDGQRHVVLPH